MFTKFSYFKLSRKKIHTIEGLTNLIKLENFYIENNYWQSQKDIRGFLNCQSLTLLDIPQILKCFFFLSILLCKIFF